MELITIDTNIIIKALEGNEKALSVTYGQLCYVSFMVDVEIRSFNWVTKQRLQVLEMALSRFIIHPYNDTIKELAIKIRRTTALKIPDAFIAATSLALQMPLFSGDDIFRKVDGLKFIHVQF